MQRIGFNQPYGLHDAAVVHQTKTMTRRIITDVKAIQCLNELEDDGNLDTAYAQIILEKYAQYNVDEVLAVKLSGIDIFRQLQKRYGDSSDAALGFKEMYQGMAFWTNKMFTPADLCPDHILITHRHIERLQDISNEDCLKEGVVSFLDIISQEGTEKYEKKADAIHWIEGGDDTHGWADQGINYCEKCAKKEAKKMNKGLEEELYRAVYSYAGGNEEDSSVFCEECGKPLLYSCLFTYLDDDLENMCLDSMCDLYLLEQILDSDHRDYAIEKLARLAFASLIDKVSGKGTWQRDPWVVVYSFKLAN